ncbi:MAG TPA: hypothetical protein VGQ58_01830 [Candidatus Limnocylindrales bacterium]|jgi:hypothetical protein|nr:hypothetical protein [Candidatus Limnocylindrales bacterium]
MTDKTQPNREERRRKQFRPKDTSNDERKPLSKANPAFGTGDDTESYAGRPDQGIVKTTGAGTGGATESDERVKEHEGQHRGNQPNS